MTPAHDDLIDALYEAAFLGDKWPALFDNLAGRFRAKGGFLVAMDPDGNFGSVCNARMKALQDKAYDIFVAHGCGVLEHNIRAPAAVRMARDGFRADFEVLSEEERAANFEYTHFLVRDGWVPSLGTYIDCIDGSHVIFTMEGFESEPSALDAIAHFDSLRPHIARSVSISARLHLERARAMTQALEAVGMPAAVLSLQGRVKAANPLFEGLVGRSVFDGAAGLRLANVKITGQLHACLQSMLGGARHARSIPMAGEDGERAQVLHLLPIVGEARDLFFGDCVLMVMAGAGATPGPDDGLLRTLFDLTPAEARVARALAGGQSTNGIALQSGLSVHTIRHQVKAILGKTGAPSQVALVGLLKDLMFAPPPPVKTAGT